MVKPVGPKVVIGFTPLAIPAKPKAPATVDGYDGSLPAITSARGKSIGAAADVGEAIRSSFPLDDLSKLETHGRWAAGFRLDGGAMRLMWLTARRLVDKADNQSIELFFFTQGKATDRLAARMKEQGAKSGVMRFAAGEPKPEAPPGQATLLTGGDTWSPSSSSAQVIEEKGKFKIELCAASPEALKGAVRLTLYGTDAECTKELQAVLAKLGLQDFFAPPTASSLERFKLMRFLWAVDPERLEDIGYRPLASFEKSELNAALAEVGFTAETPAMAKMAAIKLGDPEVAPLIAKAIALYRRSPSGFVAWASARGADAFQPHSAASLDQAMTKAGIGPGTAAFDAAAKTTAADPIEGAKILRVGLLAIRDQGKAKLVRSLDEVKAADLRAVVEAAGHDPKRLDALGFGEAYPGYFTVYDPKLAEECKEAGARYLYSTADSPERVLSMLTGGQKSSLTRFQEGVLVQGKSSSSDFNSGGAFSIFSRLVTHSEIQKAKSGGGNKFADWGGSRPFKLIINRRVLGRLDWYGSNSDSYGRTTALTAANRGPRIISTIDKNYSGSNEIMFPVGNDPANIDFVVCATEQQRTKLLEQLGAAGLTAINSRPIESFVRVETKFFEHPEDQTLEQAVRDAVAVLDLKAMTQAVNDLAKPLAVEAAAKLTIETAKAIIPALVDEVATALAQQAAAEAIKRGAAKAVNTVAAKTDLAATNLAMDAAIHAAAKTAVAGVEAQPATSQIDNLITSTIRAAGETAGRAWVTEVAQAKKVEAFAAAAPDTPKKDTVQKLTDALIGLGSDPTLVATVRAAMEAVGPAHALTLAQQSIATGFKGAARSVVRSAAEKAGAAATPAEIAKAIAKDAHAELATTAKAAGQAAIDKHLVEHLKKQLRAKAQAAAEQAALEAAQEKATALANDTALAAVAARVETAIAAFEQLKGVTASPEERAAMLELAAGLAKRNAGDAAKALVEGIARTAAKDAVTPKPGQASPLDPLVLEHKGALSPDIAEKTVAALIAGGTAIDEQVLKWAALHAASRATPIVEALINATAEERGSAGAEAFASARFQAMIDYRVAGIASQAAKQHAAAVRTDLFQKIKLGQPLD